LRPDAQHFVFAVRVASVDGHDDEVCDKQRHEPEGSPLSNLFLCAN